ncbi:hypothetical protein DY000_02007477 [Brassica cretica]|uniref:Uncharacterized protein n=1 Tax=Brassica cretica TaxID=69181 RepID=A0ABQ7CAX5_BRACR|nr:hypothetical protein DY000_02007477 [Brassica cretica]
MEGSPYQKFFFSQRKGVVPGTGSRVLPSGDLGYVSLNLQILGERAHDPLGSVREKYPGIISSSLQAGPRPAGPDTGTLTSPRD